MQTETKIKILSEIEAAAVCCVSTSSGAYIKNRMMHFAVSSGLKFYITSMKDDPKTEQLVLNPGISLLVYVPGKSFPEDKEFEVTGQARILNAPEEKEKARELLLPRSPVVAQLSQYGKLDMLAFIEVTPQTVKFRQVKDILQGVKPEIFNSGCPVLLSSDQDKFMRKVKSWVIETRYPFLTVSVFPVLLGTAIAWTRLGTFKPFYFLLTLVGTVCLHLGSNIINDYFDHKSGNDEANTEFVRPFSGGSRMIQQGLLTPLEVLMGALLFFALGSGIGLFLVFKCGLPVLALGIIGVVSGFFYTAPVFFWASRGFGEFLVGLNFGVLNAVGSYYVQTGRFSTEVLWASFPLALLVTAILWVNEISDYQADKKSGKNTLVVHLGKKRAADGLGYIMILNYAVIISGVLAGYLPGITLLALLSLPFAFLAVRYARKYYYNSFEMAPGNGFVIISFNVIGITLVVSYLLLSFDILYVLPPAALSALYILWVYKKLRAQMEAFIKVKELAR